MPKGEKTKILWRNPEYRQHMSDIHKGLKMSKNAKAKLSKRMQGNLYTLGKEPWNKGMKSEAKARDRFYLIWANMKTRCNNPNTDNYAYYGGKGISYDPSWDKFENFYLDMHDTYKEDLTIDRIDNDGNYSKENCRWTTRKEQANNTRITERAIKYTFGGVTLSISQWAKKIGVKRKTLAMRLQSYGWSIEKALNKGGSYFAK